MGKTFIACALANAACRQGYSARYYRVPRLLSELGCAKGDGSYPRLLGKLAKTRLLVLDDWGITPLSPADSRDILEIIDDRTQTCSTIVASQLPVEDWHGAIIDPSVADAILDRLVHNAHRIALKGESMRKVTSHAKRIDEYPYQLSGGTRQRAMIAMALSCHPKLLIADEPTTALDVTIQAQILDLMRDLQREFGMSIMMITHNLGVIAEMAEDVVVMYLGRIVESTSVDDLFHNPMHPYTKALLKSIPKVGRKSRERLESIKGVVPDAYNIPPGCSFHPRCPQFKRGVCDKEIPKLVEVAPGHRVSCLLYDEVEKDA